jgi:hypothetical protein
MKSAISLALVVALTISAVPVAGQEVVDPTAGPIHRAMAREAIRLGAESDGPSAAVSLQQDATPADPWQPVRKLAAGTPVVLATHGSALGKRYIIETDESRLTVLNVADLDVPEAVTDALGSAARVHPDYFSKAQRTGFLWLDTQRRVRLEPDGAVLLNSRPVVNLRQLVEQVARADVAVVSIVTPEPGRGARKGALIGFGIGLAIGLSIQIPYCRHHSCDSQGGLIAPFIVIMSTITGAAIGAGVGQEMGHVIYRAP